MVTGGYSGGMYPRNDAEYLSLDSMKWQELPDVPFYAYSACLVQLDENRTLHIGGKDEFSSTHKLSVCHFQFQFFLKHSPTYLC